MYKFILITLLSLLALVGTAQAGGSIAVIVNSSNSQTLTLKDIADIYSDKKIKWENGKKIAVYTLPIFAAESESFWQTALSISAIQAASDESNRRITNTAQNKQKQKKENLLISIIGNNSRAIGFVEMKKVTDNDKVRVALILN